MKRIGLIAGLAFLVLAAAWPAGAMAAEAGKKVPAPSRDLLLTSPDKSGGTAPTAKSGEAESEVATVVQKGHSEGVEALCFSPDETLAASIDQAMVVKLWDAAGGRLLRTWALEGNFEDFAAIRMQFKSPEVLTVFVAFGDRLTIFEYDIRRAALVSSRTAPMPALTWPYFSPDMSLIAGQSEPPKDKTPTGPIRIYDREKKEPIPSLDHPGGEAQNIFFSPGGRFLTGIFENGPDIRIGIWDLTTGDRVHWLTRFGPPSKSPAPQIAAVSGDGRYLAISGGGAWRSEKGASCDLNRSNLAIVDLIEMKPTAEAEVETADGAADMAFSPSGRFLSLSGFAGSGLPSVILRTADLSDPKFLSIEALPVAFSASGKYAAAGGLGRQGSGAFFTSSDVQIVNLAEPDKSPPVVTGHQFNWPVLSADGRYLAVAEEIPTGTWVRLVDLTEGRTAWVIEIEGDRVRGLAFSADSKFLACQGFSEYFVWNVSDGEAAATGDSGGSQFTQGLAMSSDGKRLAVTAEEGIDSKILILDTVSGKMLAFYKKENLQVVNGLAFHPQNPWLAILGEDDALVWDYQAKRLRETFKLTAVKERKRAWDTGHGPFGWSLDGQRLLAGWQVFDLKSKKSLATIKDLSQLASGNLGSYWAVGPLHSVAGAAGIYTDLGADILQIRDIGGGTLRASLLFGDAAEVFVTREGYFMGSGRFEDYIHYVKGLTPYGFNQFYDAFYRPDLVLEKLRGRDISRVSPKLTVQAALSSPPPEVRIEPLSPDPTSGGEETAVTVRVRDTGGGIGDIRLYHQGKLIASRGVYRLAKSESSPTEVQPGLSSPYRLATRDAFLVQAAPTAGPDGGDKGPMTVTEVKRLDGVFEQTYRVKLVSGENRIAVSAFNGDNTVMSALAPATVTAAIPERKPRLFVLAAGVGRFANPKFDLDYPVKDAADFADLLQKTAGPVFDAVKVEMLTDPGKADILAAIRKMAGDMNPEDVFCFFAASHGIAEDDLYYVITKEFDGTRAGLAQASISSLEIMEFSKIVPALRHIYVLDTCHSGGLGTVVSGLYDARISVMAKSLGMHILAAAQTDQAAADNYQGNGLFTYFILRGLEGKADGDQDHQVRIMEMGPYLKAEVEKASKGGQAAFIRNFGDDLTLVKTP